MSYDRIDRFLRNNLGDDDYAEYSAALDSLCTPQRKPLTDEQFDKAGMKLAECMDYPWEQMPEEGKRNMRDHAKAIIEAAHGIRKNT